MLSLALNTHICLATELSNTRHPGQGVGIKKGGDEKIVIFKRLIQTFLEKPSSQLSALLTPSA